VRSPEICSRLQLGLVRGNQRHQRETPRWQADSVGVNHSETIALSAYLPLKEANVEDFVGVGINRAVQPELLSVEADHLLVNRKLIRSDRRKWL
jgi:hypothetical protein